MIAEVKETVWWHYWDTHFMPLSSKDMGRSFLRASIGESTAAMGKGQPLSLNARKQTWA
jgi:hypothetical protein